MTRRVDLAPIGGRPPLPPLDDSYYSPLAVLRRRHHNQARAEVVDGRS